MQKYKNIFLLCVGLVGLYLFFRLVNLTFLPMFTDEAIYLRWAQIALNDANWRFISLTDGKQPLFIWVMMVFMRFIDEPLLAGRLVSVVSGLATMTGLFFLTRELFKNSKIAFLTCLIYIVYPFAHVYDRIALYDSMVGMFAVWGLYFSILLVRSLRLDIAYTLGFIVGGGVLTKTNAFFTIYLMPFTLLLFDFRKGKLFQRLIRFVLLAGIAVFISQLFYSILRLSPLFGVEKIKTATFVYPFSEWVQHPFTFLFGNLRGLAVWLFEYSSLPLYILIFVGLVGRGVSKKKIVFSSLCFVLIISSFIFSKFIFNEPYIYASTLLFVLVIAVVGSFTKEFLLEKILLLAYFLLPMLALALFGRIIYPRFIYFMSLMLLPLMGMGLYHIVSVVNTKIKNHVLAYVLVLLLFLSYPAYVSLQFSFDPVHGHIAMSDNNQYVNYWTAGWGVRETIAFLKQQAEKQPIYVGTEGTFGLLPGALELYLVENKNITIKAYWPVEGKLPDEASEYALKVPSYFIFYQPNNLPIPKSYPLRLISSTQQGTSSYYFRLYQVIPPVK